MTTRDKIKAIMALQATSDNPGFWIGNPHADSIPGICDYFHKNSMEEVRLDLKDEIFWEAADAACGNPDGWTVFAGWDGIFKSITDPDKIDDIEWPDPEAIDFSPVCEKYSSSGDRFRLGGMWAPFFHDVAAFMGMENYFIAMIENPSFVHRLTTKVVDFYCAANTRFFQQIGEELDGYFFGNDLGTQISTIISLPMFREFIFPYMKKLIDSAKSFGYPVVLHSCGAISPFIPDFIELGVNALHPVQIKASGMSAEKLKQWKGSVAFIGGIDTQFILRAGTQQEIEKEVTDLISFLGPNIVVSPSHEAILPDIPPGNLKIMKDSISV